MNKMMIKGRHFYALSALLTVMLAGQWMPASAQTYNQAQACPGWNNPIAFQQGVPNKYYWSGVLGKKVSGNGQAPDPIHGVTGMTNWGNTISAAGLETATLSGSSCGASFPTGFGQNNAFALYDSITGGGRYDANTGNVVRYVPTHFNTHDTIGINTNLSRSIRIGDACGGTNATALYYNMEVNSQNAMLYIYYACVIQAPGHGIACDPAFIIRVMRETPTGWVQVSPTNTPAPSGEQCDTLCYMVPSTPAQGQGLNSTPTYGGWGTVQLGNEGWGLIGTWTSGVAYKDWRKVALNLASLMYENIRIEVLMSDCCMTAHYAYAYIAGECRPMEILASGCPPGEATEVTTLAAPRGLQKYVWYASNYGVADPTQSLYAGGDNQYFSFRLVSDTINHGMTEQDTAYLYKVKTSDFEVRYRPHPENPSATPVSLTDSVGERQTFRCEVTSALDPDKRFKSYIYVNVTNTKPSMDIDTLSICGGDVQLKNLSRVPGNQSLVRYDSTIWMFYDNQNCLGTPSSMDTGENVSIHYNDENYHGVLVRTNINDELLTGDDALPHNACYSEKKYKIRAIANPTARMTVSDTVLCDDDETTLKDVSTGVTKRLWAFRPEDAPEDDMTLSDTVRGTGDEEKTIVRSFTHSVEPIVLKVYNGKYYIDHPLGSAPGTDTVWCSDTDSNTVRVFVHPELEVEGDTIVCQGSTTNATVNAVGVDGCTYQWFTSLNGSSPIATGNTLQVAPYADVATYYVKVSSPRGCSAWDSIHAYLVRPTLTMNPQDGRICPGDTVRLFGGDASSYTWSSVPEDPSLDGQQDGSSIKVLPKVNTTYKMVGHGDNGCDATPLYKTVTVIPMPVPKVSLEPGIVDTDDPTVKMRDVSQYSVGASWRFADGTTAEGTEVIHTFEEATGADSVHVVMIPRNELGCSVEYPFGILVNLYTAWVPNIFTPGSNDDNARFRLYTINNYEYFHIYIYNRRGEQVFESTDPTFEWDGTCNNTPMPSGAYVYICRYRKPGMNTLSEMHGTVTLIR